MCLSADRPKPPDVHTPPLLRYEYGGSFPGNHLTVNDYDQINMGMNAMLNGSQASLRLRHVPPTGGTFSCHNEQNSGILGKKENDSEGMQLIDAKERPFRSGEALIAKSTGGRNGLPARQLIRDSGIPGSIPVHAAIHTQMSRNGMGTARELGCNVFPTKMSVNE